MTGPASRVEELAAGLAEVDGRIARACSAAGRARAEVSLVAVTKTWPASDAALLRDLGVVDLGENRDDEAAEKARLVDGVRWHFVGQLQSRKAKSVGSYASVVHALDRASLLAPLGRAAVQAGRTVEVLVQVSLDGDPARGGAPVGDVASLADAASEQQGLHLAGVMAVAPRDAEPQRAFARLAEVAEAVRRAHPEASAISAGMSGDLEQAVAHGATLVRVGTALLGRRPPLLR